MSAIKKGLGPVVFTDPNILILGTMPGDRSLASAEYYAHPSNAFRKLLFEAHGERFSAGYDNFLDLLNRKHIALWNVIRSCTRHGSGDKAIGNVVPNDLLSFVASHETISMICFESKKAAMLYDRYFPRQPDITYATLASASALFAKMSYEQKLTQWKAVFDAASGEAT